MDFCDMFHANSDRTSNLSQLSTDLKVLDIIIFSRSHVLYIITYFLIGTKVRENNFTTSLSPKKQGIQKRFHRVIFSRHMLGGGAKKTFQKFPVIHLTTLQGNISLWMRSEASIEMEEKKMVVREELKMISRAQASKMVDDGKAIWFRINDQEEVVQVKSNKGEFLVNQGASTGLLQRTTRVWVR